MNLRISSLLVFSVMCVSAQTSSAQLSSYSQDFEGLSTADIMALENDGWLVFGNVFDAAGNYCYGYGSFPAPNNNTAFCTVVTNQGGPPQGTQQLVVFSDYLNGDHGNGKTIESNVFQEQIVSAADVGETWNFNFDSKRGDIAGSSTALAFIKTIDPSAGFALTNFLTQDMTSTPVTWSTYTISITIDAGLVGQLLQFGFLNNATAFEASGIFYDNVVFDVPPGTNYCIAIPNSAGFAATVSAAGSTSVLGANLIITGSGLPALVNGIGVYGPNQSMAPFLNGFRCVGAPFQRSAILSSDAGGLMTYPIFDASQNSQAVVPLAAGALNFQFWFRDTAGGGTGANTTDGLTVVFTP